MATICFRPPPLPPNKKPNGTNNIIRNRKQSHGLLSSTYHSFRDPADDQIEMRTFGGGGVGVGKRCRRVSHTQKACREDPKVGMVRSHSDGNLDKSQGQELSINRYMRVLSGSWKNLLNCKWRGTPIKTLTVDASSCDLTLTLLHF